MHQVQGKAGTASSSSSQSTLSATDVGTKDIGLIESVCEDTEMSWIFVVADAVAINQLSMDGANSLVVRLRASRARCVRRAMPLTRLWKLCWRAGEVWIFDQQVAWCSKVWGMREVVYNALDLHGRVFIVKIPFVVCEVRRPLLSLAMLEDEGFHLTVKDGCR